MELHYLKLFNIMAAELNFSKTADTLYISQPAVSMQIKKLEQDLGFKLFDKVGKNLYLNENGKLLYKYTKQIFSLIEEAETKLYIQNNTVRGSINIGASNTPGNYILPQILGEFKAMYPEVDTNLHIANTHEIERMIFSNELDFAVNGGDIPYNNQVYVEELATDDVVFVAAPSNSLTKSEFIEPVQLINAKYITHERNSQLYKLVEDITGELGLPFSITMVLGSIDAIKQAVSSNLGITIVPKSAARIELGYGFLKQLKIRDWYWKYPYNLIYHKKKNITPAAAKLIELIRERVGKNKKG